MLQLAVCTHSDICSFMFLYILKVARVIYCIYWLNLFFFLVVVLEILIYFSGQFDSDMTSRQTMPSSQKRNTFLCKSAISHCMMKVGGGVPISFCFICVIDTKHMTVHRIRASWVMSLRTHLYVWMRDSGSYSWQIRGLMFMHFYKVVGFEPFPFM